MKDPDRRCCGPFEDSAEVRIAFIEHQIVSFGSLPAEDEILCFLFCLRVTNFSIENFFDEDFGVFAGIAAVSYDEENEVFPRTKTPVYSKTEERIHAGKFFPKLISSVRTVDTQPEWFGKTREERLRKITDTAFSLLYKGCARDKGKIRFEMLRHGVSFFLSFAESC